MKIIKIFDKDDEIKYIYEINGKHTEDCDNLYNREEISNDQINDYVKFKINCESEFNRKKNIKEKILL